MGLKADLSVNGISIGYVYARRLSPDLPSKDNICSYEWIVSKDGERIYSEQPLAHRYGDGAFVLIAKVIEASNEVERT